MASKKFTQPYSYSNGLRTAFYEGMVKTAKSKGMTLSEYAASLWEEDWRAAAAILVKTLPREIEASGVIEHDHTHTHVGLSATVAFIEAALGTGEAGTLAESGEDRPLLPPSLPVESSRH